MDTLLEKVPSFSNRFQFENKSHFQKVKGFTDHHESHDLSISPTDLHPLGHPIPSDLSSDVSSPDSEKFSSPILKYINDVLMEEEEEFERQPCMLRDCLALQAAERSLYDVIGQNYPPPSKIMSLNDGNLESPDSHLASTFSTDSSTSHTTDHSYESNCTNDPGNLTPSYPSVSCSPPKTTLPTDLALTLSHEIIDLEDTPSFRSENVEFSRNMNVFKEKKTRRREENDYEDGRGSKHSAVYDVDDQTPEFLDDALCQFEKCDSVSLDDCLKPTSLNGKLPKIGQSKGSHGKTRSKKETNKEEVVDLWTLLTQCAQAVSSYDQRNATDLLKQIRQHSTPYGDGMQRLAHYFADGLQTRLTADSPSYLPYASSDITAADIFKAYKLYVTACPFRRMSNFLANRTIMKVVDNVSRLHIIDFGILYGFQWPCLIQRISESPGGPPFLRITGIELPQPGFRPSERVEKTGHCLANYCRRFNVPFEYNFIAKKWEDVQLKDLKIDRDELTVVNCFNRLKNLPDETVAADNPRDEVLRLIRRINPDIFIHGVVNGTYNAPFFATRFREALFHFSSLFDMFEATIPRDNPMRLIFEKAVYARDAMNVIACEGAARVERPETYKQWQVRNQRAGFKQIPFDKELVKQVKAKVRLQHHKDFIVYEDGKWMLQGWKGRIIRAVSCWKPV